MNDKVVGRRLARSILAMALCKDIIVEELGVDESEVTLGASFGEDLGAQPWDLVELFMAFEAAFEIKIPDETAERIHTVKHAVDFIAKRAPLRMLVPVESWSGQQESTIKTARNADRMVGVVQISTHD
jgi:acyl carrier protein